MVASLGRTLAEEKHLLRIIFNKGKFENTRELFKSSKTLNIYKLNIFSISVFMPKIQGKCAFMHIFLPKFRKPSQSYPTRFSHLNYVKHVPKLSKCSYGISYRGPFA